MALLDIRTGKEMTRGGFLKGILAAGIAPSIVGLAGSANASVGRGMMRGVGARMATMGGGKPTAKDYVQNGLVALWDGIENAGWGNHNPLATSITDCVRGYSLVSNGLVEISQNSFGGFASNGSYLESYGSGSAFVLPESTFDYEYTVDAVVEYSSVTQWTGLMDCHDQIAHIGCRIMFGSYSSFTDLVGSAANYVPMQSSRYHFTITRRGIVSRSYLNGIVYSEKTASSIQGTSGKYKLKIGNTYRPSDNFFDGSVCCLRIYNRALEYGDVNENNRIDKTRFNIP